MSEPQRHLSAANQGDEGSDVPRPARRPSFSWWHEVVLSLLLIALLTVAGTLMPSFLQWNSQMLLSRQLWEFGILAIAMTLVIISGGIDLSVGSTMGLCAVVFGITYSATGNLSASCLACVAVGATCGALNGVLIARTRIHPLLITLATYAAYRGIAEGVSQGESYSQFGENFSTIARGTWLSVPLPGFLFLLVAVAFAVYLKATPGGRFIYAIGHNETAARFSGIDVDRLKCWLYITTGIMAGVATIIYVSRFDTAKADAGRGFELDVITAVVVGGTSVAGGRGNIVGTVLGLLLIHETRLFVSRYWRIDELRSIVIGFLLIASVLIYRAISKEKNE
jgi:rhamnose transport system permease protein